MYVQTMTPEFGEYLVGHKPLRVYRDDVKVEVPPGDAIPEAFDFPMSRRKAMLDRGMLVFRPRPTVDADFVRRALARLPAKALIQILKDEGLEVDRETGEKKTDIVELLVGHFLVQGRAEVAEPVAPEVGLDPPPEVLPPAEEPLAPEDSTSSRSEAPDEVLTMLAALSREELEAQAGQLETFRAVIAAQLEIALGAEDSLDVFTDDELRSAILVASGYSLPAS